ncbi:MAG: PLP-dependent transferase [Actinobacteria bacterium]|nr:PLP-dependent transferase [Actinomycetota bacterium]
MARAPALPTGELADLVAESFADLAASAGELGEIVAGTYARLTRAHGEIRAAAGQLRPGTVRALDDELRRARVRYRGMMGEIEALGARCRAGGHDRDALGAAADRRAALAELVRTLAGPAAALVTASDWQSPSFAHAVRSAAGRLTGRVAEHVNDYKRDRHSDAGELELSWLAEYARPHPAWEADALMTGCGMSAFTTVLAHLVSDGVVRGPVVVGRSVYHECRDLVARSPLGGRVVEPGPDETDLVPFLEALDRIRPGAVFLDTLGNVRSVPVPDVPRILRWLAAWPLGGSTTVVVDTTGTACASRPHAAPPGPHGGPTVIAFESLTKMAQLGLDRTTAGMIVAPAPVAERLSAWREHLGTNAAEGSAHVVPRPDRALLERRLARLERNATLLAEHLERLGQRPGSPVLGATYPGLPGHPSSAVAARMGFRGSFLAVELDPRLDTPHGHRAFVDTALAEARARGVPLVAGASFGLDTTRIYRTASTSASGTPFVRIAAGTEHRLAVEDLKAVLGAVAVRLRRGAARARSLGV